MDRPELVHGCPQITVIPVYWVRWMVRKKGFYLYFGMGIDCGSIFNSGLSVYENDGYGVLIGRKLW